MLQDQRSWTRWLAAGILSVAVVAPAISFAEAPADGQNQAQPENHKKAKPKKEGEKKPKGERAVKRNELTRMELFRDIATKLDGLSDQQKTSLNSIFDTATTDLQALRDQWEANKTDTKQRADELRAFIQKLHDNIQSVLTPEQQAEFKKQLQAVREKNAKDRQEKQQKQNKDKKNNKKAHEGGPDEGEAPQNND